jgi:hypothetical protein
MADLEGFGEKGNRISIGVSHEATETGIRATGKSKTE